MDALGPDLAFAFGAVRVGAVASMLLRTTIKE
jgi:hypothetical protein